MTVLLVRSRRPPPRGADGRRVAERDECACGKAPVTWPSVSHRPHRGPRTGGVRRRAYWYHPPSLLPVDRCAAGGAGTLRSAGRLAACVTAPVHPGALRGDGGQHAPLSPRSLVSRPPPRRAFGQGAGRVGDRGHEGAAGLGSLVLRSPQGGRGPG